MHVLEFKLNNVQEKISNSINQIPFSALQAFVRLVYRLKMLISDLGHGV